MFDQFLGYGDSVIVAKTGTNPEEVVVPHDVLWKMSDHYVKRVLKTGDIVMAKNVPTQLVLNQKQYEKLVANGWELLKGEPSKLPLG